MCRRVFIFSLFINVIIALPQECTQSQVVQKSPISIVKLGDRFYYFGTYFKANFFKAMEFCRNNGMNLLSIETEDEDIRIKNHLISNVNKIEDFWTSGSDLSEEGHFVWLTTGNPINYTNWGYGQPNNYGKNENCLEIRSGKNYAWNDRSCNESLNFICELRDCSKYCMQ